MPYPYTSVIVMCFVYGYCLVMLGYYMLHIPMLVNLCPYTRAMHIVDRHALVHDLLIRRVRVMCAIICSLLIHRVKAMDVLALLVDP